MLFKWIGWRKYLVSWLVWWVAIGVFLMVRDDVDARYRFMYSWYGLLFWVASCGPLHPGYLVVDSMRYLRWVWIGIGGLLCGIGMVLLLIMNSGSLVIILLLPLVRIDPSFVRILLRWRFEQVLDVVVWWVAGSVCSFDVGSGFWDTMDWFNSCLWWIDFWFGWIIDYRYRLVTIWCCRLLLRVKDVMWWVFLDCLGMISLHILVGLV